MLILFFHIKYYNLLIIFISILLYLFNLIFILNSKVNAETIYQAANYAYKNSSILLLEKEKLKLSNEEIIAAKTNLIPNFNANILFSYDRDNFYKNNNQSILSNNQIKLISTLDINYHLWDNGIIKNQIEQTEINKKIQQYIMTDFKQKFLIKIFTIYINVLRDKELLNLKIKNLNILNKQEKISKAYFKIGKTTATNVALTKAYKSAAISSLKNSKIQFNISNDIYTQIIGHKPINLNQPNSISQLLPKSQQFAINYAKINHYKIKHLKENILLAKKSVKIIKAKLLPSANIFSSITTQYIQNNFLFKKNLTVGVKLLIPIYNGKIKYSHIRQEKIKVTQAKLHLIINRNKIINNIKYNWNLLNASKNEIISNNIHIKALTLLLKNIKAKVSEGIKTNIDILNNEKKLLLAKITLIISQHKMLSMEIKLLSSIGNLNINKLKIK